MWLRKFLAVLKEFQPQPDCLWQTIPLPFFPPFLSHGTYSFHLSFKVSLRNSDSSSIFFLNALSLWKRLLTKNVVLDLQLASGLNKDPQARGEMFVCIHSFLSSPSHSTVCAPKVPETEKKKPKKQNWCENPCSKQPQDKCSWIWWFAYLVLVFCLGDTDWDMWKVCMHHFRLVTSD